ncbi:ribosome maturation factor RimM [Niabella terrae]
MSAFKYISIGKIAGSHGLKGELVLLHDMGKKTAFKGLKALFIKDGKGSLLPWFVASTRIRSDRETLLKLEGIDRPEQARPLLKQTVWLPEPEMQQYIDQGAPLRLLGYRLVDQGRELGLIEEIIEQPHQLLCRLTIEGKEVLIPLHEASTDRIDHKKKTVHVLLPEGLLDIYLT